MENTEPTQTAPAAPTPASEAQVTEPPSAPAQDTPAMPQPGATPTPAAEPTPAPTAQPTPTTAVEELKEPQNNLTNKFTKAEWDALKSFREELPDIAASVYDKDPDAKTTPIVLWGVTIDPASPVDARVSVVLMKFLRARNLNVSAAREMLIATLRWRDEFNVEAACKEEFPQDVFGQLGHIYGHDKDGRPVVYNVYGGNKDIKAVFGDVPRFLRWRVAFMEKSIELLDFETIDQMVQIHDYEGVSMTSRDANSKNAASEASSIFSSHYPELLHKKFFINVPSYLSWIFWLFKPIIPAATLAKMSVVGSGAHAIGKTLLPLIDAEQLPKGYGGQAEAF